MRKFLRLWYIWFTIPPLIGLTASAVLISREGDRANRANYERISLGMTMNEVYELLGPDKVTAYPDREIRIWQITWCNGDLHPYFSDHIDVWFSDKRTVIDKQLVRAPVCHKVEWLFKTNFGVKWD